MNVRVQFSGGFHGIMMLWCGLFAILLLLWCKGHFLDQMDNTGALWALPILVCVGAFQFMVMSAFAEAEILPFQELMDQMFARYRVDSATRS